MYSGTTFTNVSGNLLGVHQKLNRSALKGLGQVSSVKNFPAIRQINHFEGKNGPDGVKTKGTYSEVQYHFYDPYDPEDTELINIIQQHFEKLVVGLHEQDREKSAFEAAWLSHAIVDGLTPAHHMDYEKELEKIRGEGKETRITMRSKLIAKGSTRRESVKKNWQIWGAKGLITTHSLFEWGVAMVLFPYKSVKVELTERDLAKAKKLGLTETFMQSARSIAGEFAYDEFYKKGWTPSLARWTKGELAPEIAKVIALAWYLALKEAGMANKP